MDFLIKLKKTRFIQSLKVVQIAYYPLYKKAIRKLQLEIASPQETVNYLNNSSRVISLSRYGDGEFQLMFNKQSIGFQKYSKQISEDLMKATQISNKHLVALPHAFASTKSDKFMVKFFWWRYVYKNQKNIQKFIELTGTHKFLDASFSRTVTELKSKDDIHSIVASVIDLWNDRNVIMVEGVQTRFGVGNGLFENAQSVKRVLTPSENSYEKIDDIVKEIESIVHADNKNYLVLCAIGPTATILANELSEHGIQTIDIGHFDLQYEYLMQGAYKRVKVDSRYDNERLNKDNISEIQDKDYLSEIVARLDGE